MTLISQILFAIVYTIIFITERDEKAYDSSRNAIFIRCSKKLKSQTGEIKPQY